MNSPRHLTRLASRAVLAASLGSIAATSLACFQKYEETPEQHRERLRGESVAAYLGQLLSGKSPNAAQELIAELDIAGKRKDSEENKAATTQESLDELRIKADEGDFRDRSNYAVALARKGDAAQAVEILEQIEKEHPGEYAIASNLGTALELVGDDGHALEWITTALRRNPGSHEKSEWVHVKILEAKLAMAKDPTWLDSHSILGLDFGDQARPVAPRKSTRDLDGREKQLHDVRAALEYQLQERLGLVEPPDAAVGNLLVDLGNLLVLDGENDNAVAVYRLAVNYSSRNGELVRKRIKSTQAAVLPSMWFGWFGALVFVAGLLSLVIIWTIGLYLKQFRRKSVLPAA